MIIIELFWTFFQTGLFSFGGGYAMIPLIQQNMLDKGWMTMAEFTDMVGIGQMVPGPFAVNIAAFAGTKMGGLLGAIVSVFGVILPSCVIVMIVAKFFYDFQKAFVVQSVLYGVRPGVTALIATAAWTIAKPAFFRSTDLQVLFASVSSFFTAVNLVAILIMAATLVAVYKFKLSPIFAIIASGVIGFILFSGFIPGLKL